ncbi:hypothetical protein OG2516_16791 [Oceanicola granulosus HTCC2516]|uniref:Thiol:disulfide interchange protein DsbD N-terminal domain-containing protein n=1 Tax=Oceanicola granulosus (strain ATCC BAA-861 / DSM 15982 / KCTC 12143 / HTCC2516) TaxID=314256 RepID=Q2CB74_OCEGH|nr:protein-disulfide reductase DsbD domain-containing protein [Oceanicola granulosus]EAR49911.1 hypothetical protein OG2516_16791 [Oceanicola granulosus HTCC2516]
MFRLLALVCGLAATPLPAAAELPPGIVDVEILPGWRTERGTHMAGLSISLAPGWKTYWRAPGDTGIPPEFLWSDIDNVAAMHLHWPVPEVARSNGMRSIVYDGSVVIPMEFALDAPGAARAEGVLELGVCADICLPVQVPVAVALPPVGGRRDPGIVAGLADRPLSESEAGVQGVTCRVSPAGDGLALVADIEMPPVAGREDVVVEAGNPAVWVSEPETVRRGGTLSAAVRMVHNSGRPFALDRSAVRITVLGETRAVDIRGCDAR